MLKKIGMATMILGIVLGALAVVWSLAIGPQLVKLPSDIDISMDFQGELTLYVDKDTGFPLGSGSEEVIPVTATREFTALPDLFTSSTAFFADTMNLTVGDNTAEPQVAHYALSRTSRKCVDSDENWAFSQDNKIDRTDDYGPLFPTGLAVGDTVSVYYDDPAAAFEVQVVRRIENWNGLGINVLEIDASRTSAPYDPRAAEVLLIRDQGLPTEISLDQIKAALKFDFDLSSSLPSIPGLPGGAGIPSRIQIPPIVTAAIDRLEQFYEEHPLTVSFNQESSDVYYIEEVTGITVDATLDRTATMSIDTTLVEEIVGLFSEHTSLPYVGSTITAVLQRLDEAATTYRVPIKAVTQNITMTDDTRASMAQEAKDKISLLNWVTFRIPVIAGAVGALILVLGIVGMVMGFLAARKATA